LLFFEDSNALVDGDLSLPEDRSPWKRTDGTLTQVASVHPSSYYSVRIEPEQAATEVLVDGKKLDLEGGQAGFWTSDKQDKAPIAARRRAARTLLPDEQLSTRAAQPAHRPSGRPRRPLPLRSHRLRGPRG
jgi:hypothetical protein